MMLSTSPFVARVVTGDARGRTLGAPTINVQVADFPLEVEPGVYAAAVQLNANWVPAALHLGQRPTFGASFSAEFHLIDLVIDQAPAELTVRLLQRIRDIKKFDTPELLRAQIAADIQACKQWFQAMV